MVPTASCVHPTFSTSMLQLGGRSRWTPPSKTWKGHQRKKVLKGGVRTSVRGLCPTWSPHAGLTECPMCVHLVPPWQLRRKLKSLKVLHFQQYVTLSSLTDSGNVNMEAAKVVKKWVWLRIEKGFDSQCRFTSGGYSFQSWGLLPPSVEQVWVEDVVTEKMVVT